MQRLARAHGVVAGIALGVGLLGRLLQDVGGHAVLAADQDEGVSGPDGVGGDEAALDELMRIALHQLAVVEGAGLTLVGIAQ